MVYSVAMTLTNKGQGEVRIPAGLVVWKHELNTARALVSAGHTVEFLATKRTKHAKSPDILMMGVQWEMKSPLAGKLSAVERNLKRAYRQSINIVFDSCRMGRLPDKSIQKELLKQFILTKNIKRLIFVNRRREVIDISELI